MYQRKCVSGLVQFKIDLRLDLEVIITKATLLHVQHCSQWYTEYFIC